MFGDFSWKPDQAQAMRWTLWKEALLDHCEKRKTRTDELQQSTYATNSSSTDKQHITTTISPLRVCIMEIGCGMTVPTCRSNAERLVCELQQRGGDVTMVRVNPDYPLASIELSDSVIPIMSRGLEAIKKIDQFYRSLDG